MTAPQEILDRVKELPAAPDVAWRVMQIVQNEEYEGDDLLRAVEVDPSITSLLLRTVNSSYVGLRQPVGSLQQAIVMLGGRKIVDIVLALSTAKYFTGMRGGYVLEHRGLWRHSVAVAGACEILSSQTKAKDGGLAFTAGLLHDLGKIVLNAYVEQSSQELIDHTESGECSFLEAEREVLGTDHCEMGALVGEKWKMPESLVVAIAHHHHPSGAPEGTGRILAHLAHLADAACMTMGIGLGVDGLSYELDAVAMEELGLEESDLARTSLKILDRLRETEEFLQV
jgi:putative nucleotidyltransferase with HDIG domain